MAARNAGGGAIAFPLAYYMVRYAGFAAPSLYLRHAAVVVQLSGARLLVEADPGEGRHGVLDSKAEAHMADDARWRSRESRPVPVHLLHWHLLVFLYVWLPFTILPTWLP